MSCARQDAIELRLNLRDALKLQLKFLDRPIELIPQFQEFSDLLR